jgi:ribA/ribD-fused uncharacterized protein
MKTIAFTKVAAPYGWLGNMSPHPIRWSQGKDWRTAEALFQALRFGDEAIMEKIRAQKSPMTAKMVAKKHRTKMVVQPGSSQDIANMKLILRLKIQQHPSLREALLATGDTVIIEDCTKRRASVWGARLVGDSWEGDNLLGKLWMELRHDCQRNIG